MTKLLIHLHPSGVSFLADESLTILQNALNNDVCLEYSCKDGSCGTCKAKVLRGAVDHPSDLSGISSDDRQNGYVLTCSAKPLSDIELEAAYYPELAGIKPAIFPCKVESLLFPVPDVALLKLKFPPGTNFKYLAGQYIDLIINGARRSYSIANWSDVHNSIELHIKKINNGLFSNTIFNSLKTNQILRLEGPFGTFFVRDSTAPIIFVAGGTGFAPVKAMVESLLQKETTRNIHVYWGMEFSAGFYDASAQQWQHQYSNIKYIPVVSGVDALWSGRKGVVHKSVLDDFDDLSSCDVYACGSPHMIAAARSDFVEYGMSSARFYSDAFTPASDKNT